MAVQTLRESGWLPEELYTKAARRQESEYQKKLKEVVSSFSEGNTVGEIIHYADRTHTLGRFNVRYLKARRQGRQWKR